MAQSRDNQVLMQQRWGPNHESLDLLLYPSNGQLQQIEIYESRLEL